jgi:trafficking protein particle complex subunit 10
LTLTSDLWSKAQELCVGFTVPVNASVKLHTAQQLKFLQVVVSSICGQRLMLSEAALEVSTGTISPLPMSEGPLALDPDRPLSYMWRLETSGPFRAKFEVSLAMGKASGCYNCEFELGECATSIVMQTKVMAASGAEVCRANALCHLQVQVDAAEASSQPLMFELLADFSMWAVCGRTAGVLNLEQTNHCFVLDVMPLTSGFLPHPTIRLSKYIPGEYTFYIYII